ncbi:hypothetical protein ACFRFU_19345 [Streptomyces sp. NPDC056704]|uniref:hypothetical protein n=1 Tax=Streptomyces sp. NPDC056704 TaxID=3345917 RepID=UPI0036C9541B
MTAPVPAPRLSPTAGLANALRRLYIRLAPAHIAARETELAAAKALNQILRGTK